MDPIRLPTITLDTTLSDLYRQACPKIAHRQVSQVLCGANSALEFSSHFPRNSKYLYQDSSFNTVGDDAPTTPHASALLQHDLAMKHLSLVPQRDAFISGNTSVVLFHLNDTPTQGSHDRAQAAATMDVLAADQRPRLVFCQGPYHIPAREAGIDLIAYKLVLDGLESGDHDLLVDTDTQWRLNSKEALATSGLPTPRCEVLAVEGHAEDARLCCGRCRCRSLADTNSDNNNPWVTSFVIPEDCQGSRGIWFRKQSNRIYDALSSRPLPFVLKNQQTFGGAGTYLVRTEEERTRLLADLRSGILRRLLSCVTAENAYLRPASLLLSDLVADPIGDYGVTFFVTDGEDGDPIFLAASEQMIENGKAWVGSTIDYTKQDKLRAKFGKLVDRVAKWLRSQGYVGPAGADVLETRPGHAPRGYANGQTNGQTNGHTNGRMNGHTNGTAAVHGEAPANGHTDGATPDGDDLTNGFTNGIQKPSNGTADTKDDGDSDQDLSCFHIVDLNVRTSGSLALPLLRTHFTSRGLNNASSFTISVRRKREDFLRMFREEFESGRMCIISWYEDPDSDISLGDVAVGGEDGEGLARAVQRVRDATDGITF
ncbi:solid-state culture-specific ATP-grasp domain-containing protein [Sodiomyces alkalinus F11]|uniref:Solid-state culture-specific ATP-grasp domain-containing protein n=1 Tax=Sodiomyces alkalinus (strain CBS 110278 / VKM F-3762 / F11) TaxID=1314773 RepID=A0A3N2PX72_SODAK|nr:solid-state culture-specific ATP-grasp domain-containing protein [Sodiomyces alkalinus F11]ROT39016.1 solid-state culture-specific ATP-grasp domain-containing protein [Sodiomyces alkalinus F11]